jgi:hypothetical protein
VALLHAQLAAGAFVWRFTVIKILWYWTERLR